MIGHEILARRVVLTTEAGPVTRVRLEELTEARFVENRDATKRTKRERRSSGRQRRVKPSEKLKKRSKSPKKRDKGPGDDTKKE